MPIRREDGELIGFLSPAGEGWAPCAVFGLPLGEATTRHDAEKHLRAQGLSYLAERWELRHGDHWITVSIIEARPRNVTLSFADYGHPDLYGTRQTLTDPTPDILRMA